MTRRLRGLLSLGVAAGAIGIASDALAYRPFDGTDADVAERGTFELELGPAHYYAQGGKHYLMSPATVLNLGIINRVELVVDFKGSEALEDVPGEHRLRLIDTDVFLKTILRRGSLQEESGPSVAVEAGPLTPELGGEKSFGAQANFIISHRWETGTIHFNEQAAYSREGNLDVFSGIILEGPRTYGVRPVTELYVDRDFGGVTKLSALVGAIWTLSDSLNFDVGLRQARVEGEAASEIRLGFTWAVRVWGEREEPRKTESARAMRGFSAFR